MTDLSTLTETTPEPPPAVLTRQNLGGLQIQKVSDQDPFLNLMIYGNSGVGKTRLAGSASLVEQLQPVLFIDIEGGTTSIRDIYPDVELVRVKTWKQMQKVYDDLHTSNPYKTIVLDSLTEIQKFSMGQIMLEVVTKEPDRDPDVPSVREWGKNGEQTRRLVRAFRDMPCNTIFTALAVHDRDSKTGLTMTTPSLSGKLKQEVAGFLDIVMYYYMKMHDGNMKRILLTTATEQQVAKDRSDRLPPVVESPTMQTLYDIITGNQ
jgi:hypothetical protein